MINPILEPAWKQELIAEFQKDSFIKLREFLENEKEKFVIYPPEPLIFRAFERTPFHHVKVVIIGQDPYHGEGQAQGLCFSVQKGLRLPPSLVNIYKELEADLGIRLSNHGDLTSWAEQGVFLLNTILTVRQEEPGSHQKKGWEQFTDGVIRVLSERRKNLVFLLWGKHAQDKATLVDHQKHLVLMAPHPSPFSAHSGFFGCRHFSKTNNYLQKHAMEPINWALS